MPLVGGARRGRQEGELARGVLLRVTVDAVVDASSRAVDQQRSIHVHCVLARCPAATVIAQEPVTITLRYLQTLTEIAAEKNSTIVFPLPIELLNILGSIGKPR